MTDAPQWVPVLILFTLLGLAYLGMWRGWRRRARRHDLPPLLPVPGADEAPGSAAVDSAGAVPADALVADGRYFGTTTSGHWLDRVVARGLGNPSSCRLSLSADGLDVRRPRDSFRVPVASLRGARQDRGIAGKVVPPHGVLVVTWQHGELLLDSGFRLDSLTGGQVAAESGRQVHAALEGRIAELVAGG